MVASSITVPVLKPVPARSHRRQGIEEARLFHLRLGCGQQSLGLSANPLYTFRQIEMGCGPGSGGGALPFAMPRHTARLTGDPGIPRRPRVGLPSGRFAAFGNDRMEVRPSSCDLTKAPGIRNARKREKVAQKSS
jgi:hypothetical protein